MLSMMNRALEPSTSFQDKIMYLRSEGFYHSICSQEASAVVDKIKDMMTSTDTRLYGLSLLEVALQENSDIFLKGQWTLILIGFLKDNNSGAVIKEYSCRILCIVITYFSKDTASPFVEISKLSSDLVPILMGSIYENTLWIEPAGKCLQICVQSFPTLFEHQIDLLMKIIFKRLSYSISSKTFEALSECFSEIPNCYRCTNEDTYRGIWHKHYTRTLNTMLEVLTSLLSYIVDDPFADIRGPDSDTFSFEEEVEECELDVFTSYFRGMCQFVNLTKCLVKLLTKKTKCSVTVPVQHTLQLVISLFNVPDKIKPSTLELQLTVSTLAQIQTTALGVLEALMLNFDLRKYLQVVSKVVNSALNASKMTFCGESKNELRLTTWKVLNLWLTTQGTMISSAFLPDLSEELFKDISPETEEKKESSQSNSTHGHQKSKKSAAKPPKMKSYLVKKNSNLICREALKVLQSLVYSKEDVNKNVLKKIYDKVIQVSYDINDGHYFPCPYDDELCRKNLYGVLLALITVSSPESPDQNIDVQYAATVFQNAMVDPSPKVARLYRRATAIGRLNLAPIGPLSKSSKERQRRSNVSREIMKRREWAEQEFIPNLPVETVPEVSENSSRIGQNANENEIQTEEYMEVENHFSEQIPESQCNGEEVLEAQSSSQGPEVESEEEEEEEEDDDDDDDEEEEEEDERSFGEEEMNQDESMFLPGKLQILNPVHINQETVQTVVEPEYESLRPCARTEAVDNSKNIHLNGVRSIVPGEDAIASSSNQPTLANENGIFVEDIDNEEERDVEEEEEITFPAEKKVPDLYDPPAKKQKIETNEVNEDLQNDESERDSRSPTLSEMKADFCCNEVEDVKS